MKPARDPEPMLQFGQQLRALRKQRGLTQQAVADHLQVDRTTYTKYEIGRVSPDPQGLARLAELFGVSVDSLLGRDDTGDLPAMASSDNPPMVLSEQEKMLVQMFRQLTAEERNTLADAAQKVFRERRRFNFQ